MDIAFKNDCKYVLSNSYDLAQEIAVFLCANMGRKLFDTYRVDKKGKAITIQKQAQYEMHKLVSYPQIARELCRATSTIYECLQKVQKRYAEIYR